MSIKQSPPHRRVRWNGHQRPVPVEPLSARVFRLRIALGYSVYELAEDSGVFVGTIKQLEAGEPVDKRELPALATALGVPLCQLLCGHHSCAERACVRAVGGASLVPLAPNGPRKAAGKE
ncbi:MAG: Helix-turn-helix domain [Candidatus Eremiobacteraeota bacterium]|nr:Helix-turn-helix domain [Candidatus Eremiobacteraeota bacterium]